MAGTMKTDFIVWGVDRTSYGPIELPELIAWIEQERVTAETWVFVGSHGAWQRAAEVPELRMFFPPATQETATMPGLSQAITGVEPRSLRRLKVLAMLSDEQLTRFLQFVEVRRVPQWATIVKQGDRGDAMYLVLDGELSVRMKVLGAERVLAKLGMGDFFGDIALFDHGPRSADVVADTSATLLRLSESAFADLAQRAPDLATPFLLAMGQTLSVRIRAGNKRQGEAATYARTQ